MYEEIKLIKNNNNRKMTDLERVEEFYNFLQGDIPDGITLSTHSKPKLTQKKAFAIIWYLQECFSIFPDRIERCSNCGDLYDTSMGGLHWEAKGKNYCSWCTDLVPENYDNHKN